MPHRSAHVPLPVLATRAAAPRRVRLLGACAAAIAVLALASAPVALAAGLSGNKAFGELATPSAETPTTASTTRTTNTESNTSNSQTLILVAAGAAIVLLGAIGFVIVRDARRVAPAGDVEAVSAARVRDNAARQAQRRAKAKAARQQRKRNR